MYLYGAGRRKEEKHMETVIAAAITAGVTLLVCLINNRSQNAQTRALIDYRLKELEKKVDKHNNVVERVFKIGRAS
jgi:dihydroorotase-like cyclic amidohydrolase